MDESRADVEELDKADKIDRTNQSRADIEELDGPGIAEENTNIVAKDLGIVPENLGT